MGNVTEIQRLMALMYTEPTSESLDARILREANEVLDQAMEGGEEIVVKRGGILSGGWRIRVAAAAMVFLAISLGVLNYVGVFHRTGVVWADVAKNVEAAKSFICWELISEKDLATQEVQERLCKHFVSPYGVRTDSYQDEEVILSSFMNYKDKMSTILVYPMKQYVQIALPEEELDQFAARSRQDGPDQIINIFLTSSEYKTIGRKNIEGVEAEGIETHDSSIVKGNREIESFSARLWVSVEDNYPVLLEYDITAKDMPKEFHLMIDGFEWNVDMPESDFIAVIPDGFEKRKK